ncbi:MAG: SRPBCC domain-containing protein [Actinomycetota bacterium]|nr:SRPBCC domain-containing protein [Actinomycetota bacterium]
MTDIVTETIVKASAERAWQAWTDASELAAWWWPMYTDTTYDLDVRPGGSYRFESRSAGIGARGTYIEILAPERLTMTWTWLTDGTDDGPEDSVSVTFSAVDDTTVVRVVHSTAAEETEGYAQGWRDCLDRLAQPTGR